MIIHLENCSFVFGLREDKSHSHYIGQKSEPILRPNFQMNADRSGMDLIGRH